VSRIDDVNQEVIANSNQTFAQATSSYTTACKKMAEAFLGLLLGLIEGLEKVMNLLDGLKKEIDDTYAKMQPFPDLPSVPSLPSVELPSISVEDLDCPIAECLGMPAMPNMSTIQYNAGPPVEPQQSQYQLPDPPGGPDVPAYEAAVAAWETQVEDYDELAAEYEASLGSYADQFKTSVGTNIESQGKNAAKILENAPQALLNGVVDAAQAAIAGFIIPAAAEAMDSMIACLVSKDPAMDTVEEIVRYRALRSRLDIAADGKPVIPDDELGVAKDEILAFRSQKAEVDSKLSAARDFKVAGSGGMPPAVSDNPLSAFKTPF